MTVHPYVRTETAEVIHSSGHAVDRSWRESFKPDLELRARARAEVQRVHRIVHAQANSMDRCPLCHDFPRAVES